MSVIVVDTRQDGEVQLMADSMTTHHDNRKSYNRDKILIYKNDTERLAISGAGYFKRLSLFQAYMDYREGVIPTLTDNLSMVNFMKDFYEFARDYLRTENYTLGNDDKYFDGKNIIIYQKLKQFPDIWAFEYFDAYKIEKDEYFALGTGKQYAHAILEFGGSANQAVRIASKLDKSCGGNVKSMVFPYVGQ